PDAATPQEWTPYRPHLQTRVCPSHRVSGRDSIEPANRLRTFQASNDADSVSFRLATLRLALCKPPRTLWRFASGWPRDDLVLRAACAPRRARLENLQRHFRSVDAQDRRLACWLGRMLPGTVAVSVLVRSPPAHLRFPPTRRAPCVHRRPMRLRCVHRRL